MAGSDQLICHLLPQYFSDAMKRPFIWGGANNGLDCLLFLADWIKVVTGVDPAEGLRFKYSDQRSARRMILDHGNIVRLVEECTSKAGMKRAEVYKPGDVGVILVPLAIANRIKRRTCYVPAGAILGSDYSWAVKSQDGLAMTKLSAIMYSQPERTVWTFA